MAHVESFVLLALFPVKMSDAYAPCSIALPPKLRRQTPSRTATLAHSDLGHRLNPTLQPGGDNTDVEAPQIDRIKSEISGLLLSLEDTN